MAAHILTVASRREGVGNRYVGRVQQQERPAGWRRWTPGLVTLLGYDRSWLRGDLIAGITVAAYLVPQVMAYAEIIGLPPVAGLWAVLAPMVVYAVLGESRQLSIGPESTTALMTAAGILALAGPVEGQRRAELAALIAVAVGSSASSDGSRGSASSPTCCPGPCWWATWPASGS